MMLIIHFIIRQEVSPVCLILFYAFRFSVLCRSSPAHRSVAGHNKKRQSA